MKKLPYVILLVAILLSISTIISKNTSAREIPSIEERKKTIREELMLRLESRLFELRVIPTIPQREIIQPTITPKPTIAPTVKPTSTPTPTSSQPHPTSTPAPTTSPITDKKQFIMNAINNYRKSLGLSLVNTDPYTCGFAAVRAKEISSGFNHDGFSTRVSNGTLPYPDYSLITENIAMTSDYRNVVNMWINSSGHAANMQKNTPYVCVESYGNYYAYEGWKP